MLIFKILLLVSFSGDVVGNGGSGSYWTVYFDSDTLDLKLTRFIGDAQFSLDICFYEVFRETVAKAVINAKRRGVKVRVITDYDYFFRPYIDSMRSYGIPVIHEQMGYNSEHIMHNKFIVRDYRDADTTNDYVWTGSYNASDYTRLNAENAIIIKDHGVATAFFYEFNQMWGDTGDIPDTLNSKTGRRKIDAYPQHLFIVGGDSVWVYFSPQNRPIQHLINFVNSAMDSIGYLIYSYTRLDLADTMIASFQRGVFVGGVHDASDANSPYSVFPTLRANGLYVFVDNLPSNYSLLHHKFMVIDKRVVVTGSMNWSTNGNEYNDENTVIVKNSEIANLYWAEFKRRYAEATGINESASFIRKEVVFFKGNFVTLGFSGFKVYDLEGRIVFEDKEGNIWFGNNLSGLPVHSGVYLITDLKGSERVFVVKIFN
ncbi:MAG: phospholipase D-like domain-containing protein [candidate division WOR-3 bacterium]